MSLGIFPVTPPDGTNGSGVDSASENEYQDISWVKGGRCVWLTTYHPCSAERQENPGALNLPGTPWTSWVCYGMTFALPTCFERHSAHHQEVELY